MLLKQIPWKKAGKLLYTEFNQADCITLLPTAEGEMIFKIVAYRK